MDRRPTNVEEAMRRAAMSRAQNSLGQRGAATQPHYAPSPSSQQPSSSGYAARDTRAASASYHRDDPYYPGYPTHAQRPPAASAHHTTSRAQQPRPSLAPPPKNTHCTGVDFDNYVDEERFIARVRRLHEADAESWIRRAGEDGGEKLFLRILGQHTSRNTGPKDKERRNDRVMDNIALSELRVRLGVEVVFDPTPDGSCLFSAIATGIWGVPLSRQEELSRTRELRRIIANGLLVLYGTMATASERFVFRSQMVASMDDQAGASLGALENAFCKSAPSNCTRDEADAIEYECDANFIHWVTNDYANTTSLQGSNMDLIMASTLPELNLNIVLINGDERTGYIERGELVVETEAMASLECIKWMSRGFSKDDDGVARTTDGDGGRGNDDEASRCTADRRTIILERFSGHYRLLGLKRADDWSSLEAVLTVGVVLRCVLKLRESLAAATSSLRSVDASDVDVDRMVANALVIKKCKTDLPLLYAVFYQMWRIYECRLYLQNT